jgi:hypothetical protein
VLAASPLTVCRLPFPVGAGAPGAPGAPGALVAAGVVVWALLRAVTAVLVPAGGGAREAGPGCGLRGCAGVWVNVPGCVWVNGPNG